jgi:hypothetical protein
LFKHFFDFAGQYALAGKPVLLAATGGSDRHMMVIDQALRPLFGFFQAWTAPMGVYLTSGDFDGTTVLNPETYERIEVGINDVIRWRACSPRRGRSRRPWAADAGKRPDGGRAVRPPPGRGNRSRKARVAKFFRITGKSLALERLNLAIGALYGIFIDVGSVTSPAGYREGLGRGRGPAAAVGCGQRGGFPCQELRIPFPMSSSSEADQPVASWLPG